MASQGEKLVLAITIAIGLGIASCLFLIGILRSQPTASRQTSGEPNLPRTRQQSRPNTNLGADLIDVRLEPYTNPHTGKTYASILCMWKNTGTAPIGALFASIDAKDPSGRRLLSMPVDEYCIYAGRQVLPGQTYRESNPEEGHMLDLMDAYGNRLSINELKVTMRIVRAERE